MRSFAIVTTVPNELCAELHNQPQLTKLVDQPPDGVEWLHEIKFDGYRMHARRSIASALGGNRFDQARIIIFDVSDPARSPASMSSRPKETAP